MRNRFTKGGKSKCNTEWDRDNKPLVDVHAHILPGVDDGARDFEETCRLLRFAVSQGFGTVIATPHASRRGRGPDRERLEELRLQAEQEIQKEYPDFRIYLGHETRYHEDLPEKLKKGEACTLAGSSYVLVEFEPEDDYGRLSRGIRALTFAGYRPVLAHVERYKCLGREEHLKDLEKAGCRFQMNYGSLEGSPLNPRVRWCRRQVLEGRIWLLGTDMHRMDFRPPDVAGAMAWLRKQGNERLLADITRENALGMIKNEGMD